MDSINTLSLAHKFLRENVKRGGFCIDATAGRGFDTVLLCELAGPEGKVLAFDIQEAAVQSTREKLTAGGFDRIGTVYQESHSNMDAFAGRRASIVSFLISGICPAVTSSFSRTRIRAARRFSRACHS